MRHKAILISALMLLWISSMASLSHAQPKQSPSFSLDIPFDFALGDRPLPPGSCAIQTLLKSAPGVDAIEVVSFRGSGRVYQTTVSHLESREVSQPGMQLVFHRYKDKYFVSEISKDATHLIFHTSQREMDLTGEQRTEVVLPFPAGHGNEQTISAATPAK